MARERVSYRKFLYHRALSAIALRRSHPYAPPAAVIARAHSNTEKKYRVRKTNHNPFFFVKPPNYRETDEQYKRNKDYERRLKTF